ncbi:MAG: hypothetical protein GXO10_05285 [Crenarchaeota archaeon]|nr:hypothetical protein [Thermoproteota archaeon]
MQTNENTKKRYIIDIVKKITLREEPSETLREIIDAMQDLRKIIEKITENTENLHATVKVEDAEFNAETERAKTLIKNLIPLIEYIETGKTQYKTELQFSYRNRKIRLTYDSKYQLYILKIYKNNTQLETPNYIEIEEKSNKIIKHLTKYTKIKENTTIEIHIKTETQK